MIPVSSAESSGILLHARHAFMPNKLGYCGPDDRGKIQQCLEGSTVDGQLISTLKNFEAAYPFLRLIAKATGRESFDYKVAEAYWIGNELLNQVLPDQFYNFALTDLRKKNRAEIRDLFLNLQNRALPHHTFYVLNTAINVISDHHHTTAAAPKALTEMVDNCRISWGRVVRVEKDKLVVKYRPLGFKDGRIKFKPYALRKVSYDRELSPFDKIASGTPVSIHWNFACDVLSEGQLRNIEKYTIGDVNSTNFYLSMIRRA